MYLDDKTQATQHLARIQSGSFAFQNLFGSMMYQYKHQLETCGLDGLSFINDPVHGLEYTAEVTYHNTAIALSYYQLPDTFTNSVIPFLSFGYGVRNHTVKKHINDIRKQYDCSLGAAYNMWLHRIPVEFYQETFRLHPLEEDTAWAFELGCYYICAIVDPPYLKDALEELQQSTHKPDDVSGKHIEDLLRDLTFGMVAAQDFTYMHPIRYFTRLHFLTTEYLLSTVDTTVKTALAHTERVSCYEAVYGVNPRQEWLAIPDVKELIQETKTKIRTAIKHADATANVTVH